MDPAAIASTKYIESRKERMYMCYDSAFVVLSSVIHIILVKERIAHNFFFVHTMLTMCYCTVHNIACDLLS